MDNSGPVNVQELEGAEKAKKERSPSFPFIPLPRAIERLRYFEQNHKRNATRIGIAAQTWGYGPKSSGAQQTIAALKAYGLLEEVSSGGERKVQITDLANRLLRDSRPGVRESAIMESAVRPKLFAEYRGRWGSDKPSDSHRISELTLDRHFTEAAARTFIKVFDETLAYAGLDENDKYEEPKSDKELGICEKGDDESESCPSYQGGRSQQTDSESKHLTERATFPLPEGLVVLDVPTKLSQASYEDLEAWMEVMLRRVTSRVVV